MSELKNQNISKTFSQTMLRRQTQVCKVFELKVDKSHLSKTQKDNINRLFLEAKWLYNHILASDEDIFSINTTSIKEAIVLNKERLPEERELTIIGSQIKQDIHKSMCSSIISLSTNKKRGKKVGRLKFRSEINSVNLKQNGVTYQIKGKNRIKVQGIAKPIKVIGTEQLKPNYELANAKLIRKHGDFFFKITCFANKTDLKPRLTSNVGVGIDFGIKTDLTLSDGTKITTKIGIGKDIKKAQRKVARTVKGSKNRFKSRIKLEKKYDKQNNIKKEIRIKVKNWFSDSFGFIAVQDENIKGWHSGWFGKQIQESAIGGIIREIKKIPHTHVVDRFFPSTQLCPECGTLNKIGLDERIYVCGCGYKEDRDTHSGGNVLTEALRVVFANQEATSNQTVPAERRDIKPAEKFASAIANLVNNCKHISVSQEASTL